MKFYQICRFTEQDTQVRECRICGVPVFRCENKTFSDNEDCRKYVHALIRQVKKRNGRRQYYLFNIKIFSYKKNLRLNHYSVPGFPYIVLRHIYRFVFYKQIRMNQSARILVHLHLFYASSWKAIRFYLENLSVYPYDLIVTYPEQLKTNAVLSEILNFRPSAVLVPCDNRGFDIGPFCHVLKKLDLKKYDIIYHIQSKSVVPKKRKRITYDHVFQKDDWFHQLFSGCFGVANVHRGINSLLHTKRDGLVAAESLITDDNPERRARVAAYAERRGIIIPKNYRFVMGTCFGLRAHLLQRWQQFDLSDFQESRRGIFSLAHAMERLIVCEVLQQGYSLRGLPVRCCQNRRILNRHKQKQERQEQKIREQLSLLKINNYQSIQVDTISGLKCSFGRGFFHNKSVFVKIGGNPEIVENEFRCQQAYYQRMPMFVPKPILYDRISLTVITRFVPGYSLEELIHLGMTKNEKEQILKQLRLLSEEIRRINYMHRDIRPANLIFSNGHLYLIDYQFAVPQNQDGSFQELAFVTEHPNIQKCLGDIYRYPGDMWDDIYSLNKIIAEIENSSVL
ncbi:MAG: hypothetical protein IJV07_05415 [Alphaproteobacteria bacterium]|nr:hypothetical protein [Alphaproteobacteria bacterium]